MSVNHCLRLLCIKDISLIFYMKVCCVFSLESPRYPKSAAKEFFIGTEE